VSSAVPFDKGLQAERTLLAWRRTCLALAVGNAAALRFTPVRFGGIAVVIGLVGLGLCAVAWLSATRRYRLAHEGLTGTVQRLQADGRAIAATCAATAVLALLAVLFIVDETSRT
jgi:uncharacterized membrane protein YidH (DUF202 family)